MKGITGQKKDTFCTQSTPRMCGTGDKWCRAPAHKLGPSGDITHQGAGRNILVNQIQEAHDTETANSSKSAALVRTLQVYRAEATVHTEGHGGKGYLERLKKRGSFH